MRFPSTTPYFADATYADFLSDPTDQETPWDLYDGGDNGPGLGRVAIARHGSAAPASAPRSIANGAGQLPAGENHLSFFGDGNKRARTRYEIFANKLSEVFVDEGH
jgi:hypothetical protein